MKNHIFATIGLLALTAQAPVPVPANSEVIVLPMSTLTSMGTYLNTRPIGEAVSLWLDIQRCAQDQVPGKDGAIKPRGGCPEIAEALNKLNAPAPASTPAPQASLPLPVSPSTHTRAAPVPSATPSAPEPAK